MRALSIVTLVLLWFGFAASDSYGEVIAAVLLALLAIAWLRALGRHGTIPAGARLRWIGQAARSWPLRILGDTGRVIAAVVRPRDRHGALRRVALPDAEPIAVAWSIIGTSISPNAYVVGWDDDARELLVHELVPSGKPDESLVWRPR